MNEFEHPHAATPLDPDEADGLLLTHITTREVLNRWEQENILRAVARLERSKERHMLSEHFVRRLHKEMFGEVWRWAGKYRTTERNLGVAPYRISSDVKALCEDAATWIEHKTHSSTEFGARFHHRLVSIHPFPNGNGRHARLMTDLLLENKLGASRFTWGGGDLARIGNVRERYIAALHAADEQDFGPLVKFVES